MDKIFSSTKHELISYYVQSVVLGKETKGTDMNCVWATFKREAHYTRSK